VCVCVCVCVYVCVCEDKCVRVPVASVYEEESVCVSVRV